MHKKFWQTLQALGLILLVVACRPEQPTATISFTAIPSRTPVPATVTPPRPQATLPPTWTRTFTPTPLPTRTATATASPPATLTADEICNGFQIIASPANNAQFDFAGTANFAWRGVPTDSTLVITLGQQNSTQTTQPGIRVEVPIEGDGVFPFPLMRLPTNEGLYEWKIWLQHPIFGAICTHSGTFLRRPAVPVLQ